MAKIRSIRYRLKDSVGNYRSGIIHLVREENVNLEASEIVRKIRNSGKPEKSYPRGFDVYFS